MRFSGSLGIQKKTVLSNYYLHDWFGEKKLRTAGIWLCSVIIGIMFAAVLVRGVLL